VLIRLLSGLLMFTLLGLPLLQAQVNDNFSDGNFSANPAWTGDINRFTVNPAFQLQSAGLPQNDTIFLQTPFTLTGDTEWLIDLDYSFAPSNTNFLRFYLFTANSDLTTPSTGYFVQVGETGNLDSYDLFRQDGSGTARLIDGTDGLAANRIDGRLRVTRSAAGVWEMAVDSGKTGDFTPQGQVMDLTYDGAGFLGIWVRHTSTRSNAFIFDNLYAGPVVVDTVAPTVASVTAIAPDSLRVDFSEALAPGPAGNVASYLVSPGGITPQLAAMVPGSDRQVGLKLPAPLANGAYQLAVQGISDLAGNVAPASSHPFSVFVAGPLPYRTIRFSEVMADPNPVVNLPDAEYFEVVNTGNDPVNLLNWQVSNGTTTATMPAVTVAPGAYHAFCRQQDLALFGGIPNLTGLTVWPALVNTGDDLGLRTASGALMDTLNYRFAWYRDPEKDDGGYSLELIDPQPNTCADAANWQASVSANGGTPGAENSTLTLPPDTQAPQLAGFSAVAPDVIEVCFDEGLAGNVSDLADYTLTGSGLTLVSVAYSTDNTACIRVRLSGPVPDGVQITLSGPGFADCRGNVASTGWQISLVKGRAPAPFDLVFTEIFPDPTPSQGLPENEFAEIFNRSASPIDLTGLTLSDGSSIASLPPVTLLPGAYAMLVPASDTADWSGFGRVLGLSSLPTQNNTADSLFLTDAGGQIIDYVYYTAAWADPAKADGGWTLEKRDPNLIDCNQQANWASSSASVGGTPGNVNSVNGTFSDTEPPQVAAFSILSRNQIELRFSEPLDPASATETARYSLTPGLGEPVLAFIPDALRQVVILEWAGELDSATVFTLTFSNITDCAGQNASGEVQLGFPRAPQAGDVLINEVLFNPFSGGADYVEIYHNGSWPLDLRDLLVGEGFPEDDSVFNEKAVAFRSTLFLPGQVVCLTADVAFQRATYLPPADARLQEMLSFPSYDDTKGAVTLRSREGILLDRFDYLDDYQYPTLDDVEGVSLERISVLGATQDPANWQSAAEAVRFGTPGYENSQALRADTTEGHFRLVNRIFSPDGDGRDDVLGIVCNFPFPASNLRIQVFDVQGRLIHTLQNNTLLGRGENQFFWNGLDTRQKPVDVGMYIVVGEVIRMDTNEKAAYRRVAVCGGRL
jgi:hypothetical protein